MSGKIASGETVTCLRGEAYILLPLSGRSRSEREQAVEEALDAVGLLNFIDYYPWQLSGAMQQRVAYCPSACLNRAYY